MFREREAARDTRPPEVVADEADVRWQVFIGFSDTRHMPRSEDGKCVPQATDVNIHDRLL